MKKTKKILGIVLAIMILTLAMSISIFATTVTTEDDLATELAQVGDEKFATVLEALDYAIKNSETEVKILESARELMPTDVELILNADLTIIADAPVEIRFYNSGTNYDFVINSNNNNTFTIGENVSFILEDRIIWLGYYGNNVDVVVNGTLKAGSQLWVGADLTVNSTGKAVSSGEALVIRRGATLKVDGGELEASYFSVLAGNIVAENGAEITSGPLWISNTGNYANEGNVNISIKDSTLTCSGNLKTASNHADGVNVTFDNSTVTFSGTEHGASVVDEKTEVTITNAANVTFKNVTNNGTIVLSEGTSLSTTNELTNVEADAEGKKVVYENGEYVFVEITLPGSGTAEDPYLITSLKDLKWFRDEVNAGNTYDNQYIKLTADIDLNNEEWTPIGTSSNVFMGMFDGGNNTISNLYINWSKEYVSGGTNQNYAGLFGYMKGGNNAGIKNLTVENANVTGCLYVGVVLGRSYTGGIVENCHVTGSVKVDGYSYVGGLIGRHEYSNGKNVNGDMMAIYNCSVVATTSEAGTINGDYAVTYVGGIVGFMAEGNYVIDECTVKNVAISGVYGVGGVSGIGHYGNTISDATVEDITVISTNNDPDSNRTDNVGLIAGAVQGTTSSPTKITNITVTNATGSVTYTDETTKEITNLYGNNMDGSDAVTNYVAMVNGVGYDSLQDAIKAAAPSGTVELLRDVTVDKWVMITESLTIADGRLITLDSINGLTINGNDHTLTINSIESAGNGNRLFYDATELNIKDLTIEYADGVSGGIGLKSGTISNVTFVGGSCGVLPGTGDVTIEGCTFKTNGTAIYFEAERNNLVVDGNTFACAEDANVILLRGNVQFTNNIIESGRTVNVVSGSPVVTGNNFGEVRFKVYNEATAKVSNNEINNLVFNDDTTVTKSAFTDDNDLSADAQAALKAVFGLTGSGTAEDPYLITSLDDLKWFRDNVNAGNTFKGKYIKLTADIDLNREAWTPIGTEENPFMGIFDGGNKTVSNLVVNGKANQGFFGYATGAKINNLNLVNVTVTGTDCVGAVVGQGYASTYIDNCHVSGNIQITGQTNVGGIVGKYYARVTNSSVIGDGTATSFVKGVYVASNLEGDNVGGIMGHAGENNTHSGNTVKNITVSGTRKVGGLIGTTDRATDLSGCTVDNVVVKSTATADYVAANTATATIGGLIGNYYGGSIDGTVTDCTVKNVIFEKGNALYAGPIVGGNRTTPNEAPTGVTISGNTVDLATITGANNYYLMTIVAQIGDNVYATLEEAFKAATSGCTIEILQDVTIDYKWDCRNTGAKFTVPVTINGNGHKLTFTNVVYDGGNYLSAFRFEADATVKNLTIDMSNASSEFGGRFRAISAKSNLTVDNCTFIGNGSAANTRAIIFGESAGTNVGNVVISITNSTFNGWRRAISDNENAQDVKSVTITGNTINDASVYVSAKETVTFTNNTVVDGDVSIMSYTDSATTVTATDNTLDADNINVIKVNPENVTADEGFATPVAKIGTTYYTDLKDALAAAKSGDTITLLADVSVTESLVLNAEGAIVIDGNGHKISQAVGYTDKQNALIMLGNSGWNDAGTATHNYTFKNVVFDGVKGWSIIRSQGVTATVEGCTFQNCNQSDGLGLLTITYCKATITNCTFKDNVCVKAIDFNSWGDNTTLASTVENCEFTNNKATGAGIIYRNKGALSVKNSKFVGNIVSASGNAATLYIGWGANDEITGCYFEDNSVTTSHETTIRFASAIFCDGCVVNNNVFVDNTATRNGEAISTIVAVGACYGAADISDNYWGGNAPVKGTDYTVEYTKQEVAFNSYYTSYEIADGVVVLGNKVEVVYVAQIGDNKYTSLQDAINAANGKTVTLLADINLGDTTVTVPAGVTVTLDLNGKVISGECNANQGSMIVVSNTAKLTIKDSSSDGTGKITYAVGTSNVGFELDVEGDLVLESGTIELTGSWSLGFAVDVRPNAWGTAYTASTTFVMNGGKIVSSDTAVRVDSNSSDKYEPLGVCFTMNGGVIESNWDAILIQQRNANKLYVNVKDGEISGTNSVLRIFGDKVVSDVYLTVEGGSFTGVVKNLEATGNGYVAIKGGTFDQLPTSIAEGYAAIKNLDGNYVVGKAPTATVNDMGPTIIPGGEYGIWDGSKYTSTSPYDMPLSFVMQFLADQTAADMATSPYADWYADFVITFDGLEGDSFIANGCYLAGYYGDFGWVKIPVDGMMIEEGVRYPVMLGVGLGQKYDYICSGVKDFKCALYITEEILAANPNLTVNLELAVVDNSKGSDAATNALVSGEDTYKVVDYDYEAEDFVVNYVAQVGDNKYTSLADALAAASAGETITLLDNITEDVTITKNITLDGNGKNYTGTITISGQYTVTIQNVSFVKGYISYSGTNSISILNVKNCSFADGGYAITTSRIKTVNIENCTVTNQSLLYAKLSTVNINVKNVTISGGNYGAHIVYGSNATFENVTMTDMIYGIMTQNHGEKTITIKNCSIDAEYPIAIWVKATATDTFNFVGENNIPALANVQYAKYVLTDAAAKLVAPEGLDVTTSVERSIVKYVDGAYEVFAAVAKIGETYYGSLQDAINAANGKTVTLLDNITLDTTVTVAKDTVVTLDLNGKTITGTDNTTTNFGLFTNKGTLTIKDSVGEGKITLAATVDSDWNRYSTVISNQVGGKLIVESGTIEHLGGTDMAYAIDNLTNGKGTYAETIINDGIIKSAYIAIRQFLNGVEAQNILTVNGGTIEGGIGAIFFQDPSKNANTGTLTIGESAYIEGNIYLSVTVGSTEWPVTVSIAASALNDSKVISNDVPEGYAVKENNGIISVVKCNYVAEVNGVKYESLQDAINAANGETVTLLDNITLDSMVTVPAGVTVTLDLNGYIISMETVDDKVTSAILNKGNLTITDSSEAKSGKISYNYTGTNDKDAYNTIESAPGSILTVDGGTIENLSANCLIAYAIDGLTNGGLGDVTVNINGGTITSKKQSVRIFANSTTCTGTLNISGGVFSGRVIVQNSDTNANKAALKITGGTFNANEYKTDVLYVGGSNGAYIDMTPVVSGGIFNGEIYSNIGKGFISGGTFNTSFDSSYLAKGCALKETDGVYIIVKAHFESGAYAQENASKPREFFAIGIHEIYAEKSLVIKVYDQNGNLMVTATYRDYDLDEPETYRYPLVVEKYVTSTYVVSGKDAGSWENVWVDGMKTVAHIPTIFEVYADDVLCDTWTEGFAAAKENAPTNYEVYCGFDGIYKEATVTDSEGNVTYYATLQDAIDAANDETVTLLCDVEIGEAIVINGDVTIDLNGKKVTLVDETNTVNCVFNIIGGNVTITNGTIETSNGQAIYVGKDADGEAYAPTVTLTNVTLTGANFGLSVYGDADVTIGENVTITGNVEALRAGDNATVTINDATATITCTGSGDVARAIAVYGNASLTMTDGKVNGEVIAVDADSKIAISGGIFDMPVKDIYCADGYICVANGDGTYTVVELELPIIEEFETALVLGEDFKMSFYMPTKYFVDGVNYYAKIVKHHVGSCGEDVVVYVQIDTSKVYQSTCLGECYRVVAENIAAKEMNCEISCQVFAGEKPESATAENTGRVVSGVATDSIVKYAEWQLTYTKDEKLKTLIIDMLNYGAAAQLRFNHYTERLANYFLTDEQNNSSVLPDGYEYQKITTAFGDTSFVNTSSLTLESSIYMNFYLKNMNTISNPTVVVSFTHHNGTEEHNIVYTIGDEEHPLIIDENGNAKIVVDDLAPADSKIVVNCKIYDGEAREENLLCTIQDSIESYCAWWATCEDATLADVCKKIVKYSNSAYAYFHQN